MDTIETGKRVAMAMVYGKLTEQQVADLLGVSTATVGRIKSGQSKVEDDDLTTLAEAAGLSLGFFEIDFAAPPPTAVERRVRSLEERVGLLEAREQVREAEEHGRNSEGSRAKGRPRPERRQ